MKKIYVLWFLIASYVSLAQGNSVVTINWVDKPYPVYSDYVLNIPHFKSSSFYYNDDNKSILYIEKFKIPSALNVNSLKLSNVVFETISEEKLGDLSKSSIPKAINSRIENSLSRDVYYGVFTFSPIIKEGNVYKRVTSLSFSYDLGTNIIQPINNKRKIVSSSILKNGVWKRFYVERSGVYKVTKSFLNSLGVDTSVDPRNIKICGNGGRMVPLANNIPYPDDVAENAIYFKGEQDGVFNDEDYILFYAEGVDQWNEESETHVNLYANKSYYYVSSSSSAAGKRISAMVEPNDAPTVIYTTFDNYRYHEIDRVNIGRLGRRWFGEEFKVQNEQSFSFNFPNIVLSEKVSLNLAAAAVSSGNSSFSINLSNLNLDTSMNFSPSTNGSLGSLNRTEVKFNPPSADITVKLNYNNNGLPSANAYLDYIILKAKCNLSGYG
jgi:hypothetical protein